MAGMDEFYAAMGSLNQALMNGANMAYASQTHKQDRAFTREMYEKQVQTSRENWELMNRYNLPSAIRQRYEDAGLNPLLLYGEGGASMTAAGNIGNSSPQISYSQVPRLEAPGTQLGLQMAQIKSLSADSALKEAQALSTLQSAKESESRTEGISLDNAFKRDSYQLRIDTMRAEIDLKHALEDTEESKQAELAKQVDYYQKQIDYIDNKMSNENRMTDAEIKEIDNRIDIANKQLSHQIALMDAQARLALADAYLARVTANIKKETEGQPEWQQMQYYKLVGEVYESFKRGDAVEIQNALNGFKLAMKPHFGAGNFETMGYIYQKFVHMALDPIGDILGSAVGGIGAAVVR